MVDRSYSYDRLPVGVIHEGYYIRPEDEPLLSENDYIEEMDDHMEVFAAHGGHLTARDISDAFNRIIILGKPNEDEDMGRTLILRSPSTSKGYAVYFPDGEYEIEVATDLNEEWS